ncbi:Dpy 30 motif [Echinococcus multilocularis]|uniref:Dpy 30 motif n=1 Tax=Echinococcus multilocularis TaxID=6211 RepID=A0A087VXX8_ECHMU|nr:Dpy 30 motif [Echinococcus multilocularis]
MHLTRIQSSDLANIPIHSFLLLLLPIPPTFTPIAVQLVQVNLLLRLGQSKSYSHGTRYCRGILNGGFVSKIGYRQGHLCLLTNPHLSLMYQGTPSNDQAFLIATLGDALREGLTQLVIKSPPDPIDFLANFLKSYSMKQSMIDY